MALMFMPPTLAGELVHLIELTVCVALFKAYRRNRFGHRAAVFQPGAPTPAVLRLSFSHRKPVNSIKGLYFPRVLIGTWGYPMTLSLWNTSHIRLYAPDTRVKRVELTMAA